MKNDQHTWISEVQPGELVAIGENIVLRVEAKSGQRARIRLEFTAPMEVKRIDPGMSALARAGVSGRQ